MAYVGSNVNVSGITGVTLPGYWANNQVYGAKEGTAATDGFRQFTGLASGDETLTHTRLEVGSSTNVNTPFCLTYDGWLLYCNGIASNSRTLAAIKVTDLSLASTFGISNR